MDSNKDLRETVECMDDMNNKAKVWTMVKIVSSLFEENEVTYRQFIDIFNLIEHYTRHEAELMCSEGGCEIDLDGEDGEFFDIPSIG